MRRVVLVAAVMSVGLLLPQHANAIWTQPACGGSTLQTCVDFDITQDADGRYYFGTTFVSSHYMGDSAGVITGIGIYDLRGDPVYNLTGIKFEQGLSTLNNWKAHDDDSCHTAGDGVGKKLFEACADADASPIANGIRLGDRIVFSFMSSQQINDLSFSEENGLGARVHIQSYSDDRCSVKLDSRLALDGGDGFFSGEHCRPTTEVPEPMTMLLLGSGLFGIGGIAIRRRRRELDIETEASEI